MLRLFSATITNRSTVLGCVMVPDPHHFGKIRIRIKVKSWIRICIKWKAGSGSASKRKGGSLRGSFWSIGGSKEKVIDRIRIRNKLKGRIRIRIQVMSWIRIRIKEINWIRIRVNLQMTDEPKCKEYEPIWAHFQGFELYLQQDPDPDPQQSER
jgi:hypothetical protein